MDVTRIKTPVRSSWCVGVGRNSVSTQWDVAWRNYVHEQFRDKHTESDKRRRDLVLDLSIKSEAVATGEIMNLSPRIAREFAGKSHRTLQRDLSILVSLGLIERTATHVRAKKEIILAFLP